MLRNKAQVDLIESINHNTNSLPRSTYKQLTQHISTENAVTIIKFIKCQKIESNLSDTYKNLVIRSLITIIKCFTNKNFKQLTRIDIIDYLDSLRKAEEADPEHKWIGTYNLRRVIFLKFFKWLYNPIGEPKKRKIPDVMRDIPMLNRKEQSIYKPDDLWSPEDDQLFLKYCHDKRIQCYHAISRDTSARPSEILKLRVKEINFKRAGDKIYAEISVNGKTGSRVIPLFSSVPYIKDWINNHPQPGNPNALLMPSMNRATLGRKMSSLSLYGIYHNYKTKKFPRLLDGENVPIEDKNKIRQLLKKPWNPYIRRHSALTDKSLFLKEHVLRQHAGWSPRSQMHLKYLHYFGNESSDSILETYGIITKDKAHSDYLRSKQCPNCNEPNKPDSKFCAKCRMVLTYDEYRETLEKQQEKELEIQNLVEKQEQDMRLMREEMENKFKQILVKIDVAKLK